jgi:hypothetical protein
VGSGQATELLSLVCKLGGKYARTEGDRLDESACPELFAKVICETVIRWQIALSAISVERIESWAGEVRGAEGKMDGDRGY